MAEQVTTIGMVEGPEEYLFGDVSAVVVDTGGMIYVADRIAETIRVYDGSGQFVATLGRHGRGPGEFENPYDMTFGPDGRLYVREAYRISVFQLNRERGIWDSFVEARPHQSLLIFRSRRGAVDSAGRYYDPNYNYPNYRTRLPPQYSYGVYTTGSLGLKTLPVPAYHNITATRRAFYMITESGGRMVRGLSHAPFEPVPSWTATSNGTIIGGDGREYVLVETNDQGDTVRIIRGPRARRAIPELEAQDSVRALRARIDSLPVPLSEVIGASELVRSGRLPDSIPAFIAVHVGSDQNLWVEQWPPAPGSRLFDVLTPGGQLLRAVQFSVPLEREPVPYFTRNAIYGVVRDPATDVQRVVKLVIHG